MAALETDEVLDLKDIDLKDDDRLLTVTINRKGGKIGWVRDCETLMIESTTKGGAADVAGIKAKMRILSINNTVVLNDEDCTKEVEKAGDTFTVTLEKDDGDSDFVLDKAFIEKAKSMTLSEQVAYDSEIMKGVDLFMNNEYAKAEKLFESHSQDPVGAVAWGTIAFLRALMSFAPRDMKEARRRLNRACNVASQIHPPQGIKNSLKSLIGQSKPLLNYQLRCKIAATEAMLLKSILLLTEDSIMSFMRAGIGLRRGYLEIESLSKQTKVDKSLLKTIPPGTFPAGLPKTLDLEAVKKQCEGGDKLLGFWPIEIFHTYDYNTIAGLQFGLGSINCCLSYMPQRILQLLSLFGFMCNRESGFKNLETALAGKGIRSAISGLFLTIFHGVLPSFSSVLSVPSLPTANSLSVQLLSYYPDSSVYLWVAGRVRRLGRDVHAAIDMFQKAIDLGRKDEFIQLTHISFYELAWCHCFELEWEKAIPLFEILFKESEWSKSFNCFAIGCCHDQLNNKKDAQKYYELCLTHLGRKFGGRTISVEQFIDRKVTMWKEDGYKNTLMPGVELMMMFNAFTQMRSEKLQTVISDTQSFLAKNDDLLPEQRNIIRLILANAEKETGNWKTSRSLYLQLIDECPVKKWKKRYKQETYILPYTYYELACLEHTDPGGSNSASYLKEAEKFRDFNFEMPLSLRMHLTHTLISKSDKEREKAKPKEQSKSKWSFFGK
eukprot:TRINITY_DN904_c0_g1_i1.p1 TRINITY_DN904_c0_g1~~TRINITY_DN904_c0_g1_i1.p1  ORF type:complete len:720 (+),score=112.27 TRINITY_DN904_c0_g1_i1:38-2197(+)